MAQKNIATMDSMRARRSGKRRYGVTLPELLMVLFIIALTGFVIVNIWVKATKLYARTSVHIEPQAHAMLAFKRMEREIRRSMEVSTSLSPSTWIEIRLPELDDQGLNKLGVNSEGRIALIPGKLVHYFLGKKLHAIDAERDIWVAKPDVKGTSLFRALDEDYHGSTMQFDNARLIVDHIVNPTDPALTTAPDLDYETLGKTLFVYTPYDNNGTPDDYSDDRPQPNTNLIAITLIVKSTLQGLPVFHPLQTKFCLRNMRT